VYAELLMLVVHAGTNVCAMEACIRTYSMRVGHAGTNRTRGILLDRSIALNFHQKIKNSLTRIVFPVTLGTSPAEATRVSWNCGGAGGSLPIHEAREVAARHGLVCAWQGEGGCLAEGGES
jgi:hypothetical protein